MMMLKLKHWLYDYHLAITVSLTAAVFVICGAFKALQSSSFLIPTIGAVLGFSYFVLKQKLDETHLFKELYKEFNERYDKMNERLYKIREDQSGNPISDEDRLFLYDYFNLCSEEFLYYKKGYIYPEVWTSWHNGMVIFCGCGRIRQLWEKESATGSYYGLIIPQRPLLENE